MATNKQPAITLHHQSDKPAGFQREGSVLRDHVLSTVQGSVRAMAQRYSFGLSYLEALSHCGR